MTLYVCATPIGNLEDITLRALRILREVDLIAAEDTRRTQQLCAHFEITTPLVSCHAHNEAERAQELVAAMRAGKRVAYVSDAGTPGVSDPGQALVRAAVAAGIPVVPVPGASAVTAALSVAGFAADGFCMVGFLPRKAQARREALEQVALETRPVVLFEAPHRILATLRELADVLGRRPLVVARELTKVHETFYRGDAAAIAAQLQAAEQARGEFTIVVGPEREPAGPVASDAIDALPLAAEVTLLVEAGLPEREAIRRVARGHGLSRQAVYRAVKIERD